MPLIIISGTPCSGKTTRAMQLKSYFEDIHGKVVDLLSEADTIEKFGYEKNSFYLDSQKEKRVRGFLKSEAIRLIGSNNVVILDGANYIKGYRYELYCASKASKSTQCTIYTILNVNTASELNERRKSKDQINEAAQKPIEKADEEVLVKNLDRLNLHSLLEENMKYHGRYNDVPYDKDIFDALVMRFEEPNSQNRWDSPLFTLQLHEPLDLEAIYKALFENKPPPPNMSTQNPPLSSTNFLYELDKVTQEISKHILDTKKLNLNSDLKFPEHPNATLESSAMQYANAPKLLRLRRQFLSYAKMQCSNENPGTIGRMYIQYLNNTLQE